MNVKKISTYLTEAIQNPGKIASKPTDEKVVPGNAVASDKVELSKDYRDLAAKQAAVTTDVRAEKVSKIMDRLESGQYEIRPDEIAEKMMGEIL